MTRLELIDRYLEQNRHLERTVERLHLQIEGLQRELEREVMFSEQQKGRVRTLEAQLREVRMSEQAAGGASQDVQGAANKLVDGAQELANVAVDFGREEAKVAAEALSVALKSLGEAAEAIKKAV